MLWRSVASRVDEAGTCSTWIGCNASAGLFCFGLELSEGVYKKRRLVSEICTQTAHKQEDCDSTCWDVALIKERGEQELQDWTIYMDNV